MERTCVVEGRWPFPVDMLRSDGSRAATPEDASLIERLSGETTDDGFGLREAVRVTVTMEAGDPVPGRPGGRFVPNEARWDSFGWKVISAGEDFEADRRLAALVRRNTALRRSGLAKLTPEEREALGLPHGEA